MKPLRIEFVVAPDRDCLGGTVGFDVYNAHNGGERVYGETIEADEYMEAIALFMDKYITNRNLRWNKVEFNAEIGGTVLYGMDMRS